MASPSELESKSRLILGLGLLSLGLVWLLKLLWPVLILIGISTGCYWLWQQQHRKYRAYQRRQDRLSEKFCYLLQQRQGRISALEFAMHTRVNSRDSQRYLHAQAQAFSAFFERTVHGDIVYIFDLAVVFSLAPALAPVRVSPIRQPAPPAELAWAHAERTKTTQQKKIQHPVAKASGGQSAHSQDLMSVQPTVRGRASSTHESIVTIDVAAVNE